MANVVFQCYHFPKQFLSNLSKVKYLAFFIKFCFVVSLAKMVTLTNNIAYKKSALYRKYICYLLFILMMILPKNSSLSLCATFDSVSASFPNRDIILISILIPRFLLEAECTRLSPYSGCLMPQLLKVFLKKQTCRVDLI